MCLSVCDRVKDNLNGPNIIELSKFLFLLLFLFLNKVKAHALKRSHLWKFGKGCLKNGELRASGSPVKNILKHLEKHGTAHAFLPSCPSTPETAETKMLGHRALL